VSALPPDAEEFLRTHTRTFLVTLRPDGAPTCHPMVGLYHEGALYLTTYRKSAKVRNLTADPRVACVVVTPDDDPELRGVVLRGRAEILAAGAVMPWTPEAPRPAGTGAGVARLVQSRVAEGKRVVVRLVPDEVRAI
jgi:PPOX class probable F420-dependent enzyme